MPYTARGLIDYARSLADLQNSKFISYSDELTLINEAYRDIYSQYTESDGDYWVVEAVFTMSALYNDPNNQYGYLIPLPTDFQKIRSLSYNYGSAWAPVQKFAMSDRDYNPGQPKYRIINGNLWVIGAKQSYAKLKIDYYPVPQLLTAPDESVALAAAETQYNLPLIGSHVFVPASNKFIYALGNVVKCQNLDDGTTATLYTSANAIEGLSYYAGYIFWRDTVANIIYRAPTDFVTTLVPASIKTLVLNFSIQNGFIYFAVAATTRKCNIDGTGEVQVLASTSVEYTVVGANYMTVAGGVIVVNGVATLFGATMIIYDGLYLFALDSARNLTRYKVTAAGVLTVDVVVDVGILTIGSQAIDRYLSVITYSMAKAISLVVDTVLAYPTNEVNEILAYTSASAYARKQSDIAKQSVVEARLLALWTRFWNVNKRDEYQNTRINNDYQPLPNNW